MSKLNEKLIEVQCKTQCAVMNGAAPEKTRKRIKYARLALIAVCVVNLLMMMAFPAFADSIESKIAGGMQDVYKVIIAICVPIAVIAFAFAGFQAFAGGEKGMEKAKKTALYTIIALGVILLAPIIINQVAGWFESDTGDASIWDGTWASSASSS